MSDWVDEQVDGYTDQRGVKRNEEGADVKSRGWTDRHYERADGRRGCPGGYGSKLIDEQGG